MSQKIAVKTGTVEETLLLPLWGRAYETRQDKPRLVDTRAVEIIDRVDYDFTTIEKTQAMSQHGWVARSLHTDKLTKEFITRHPEGSIVNIGCGLDTTFSRIDNGTIMYYELDLPEVIALRKNFIEESERHKSIASSFLDTQWFGQIATGKGLLFLAGGVFCYFNEQQIKNFFIQLADTFKECELYFDALSPMAMKIAKKQVLKKGGMGMSIDEGWALKPVKKLESWDSRFTVLSATPMYQGMRDGLPLKTRLMFAITDALGVCPMVHLRISSHS